MLDATELRRASATDAAAVQQYLRSIDSDELNLLLDAFADAERNKKDEGAAHEWLALVHLLLRTSTTRQRTATRILQSLWRGQASEMEALRWVSEISLGYMTSVAAAEPGVSSELIIVIQITFEFVRDTIAAHTITSKKTLPQLLALVPALLNLLEEASSASATSAYDSNENAMCTSNTEGTTSSLIHEHVVELLELPWNVRSVSHLLELLRDHPSLVSRRGWIQLRGSVEQLVTPTNATDFPIDCINPIMRECLLLATVSADADSDAIGWIRLVRILLRRLPTHLRQEAEFNIQMSLHQSPSLAPLICTALQIPASREQTSDSVHMNMVLDISDAVLLLHAVRASKPLLHHHLANSAPLIDVNSISYRSQDLILRLLTPVQDSDPPISPEHIVRHFITNVLEFGGRHQHMRMWKARLLHDFARSWAMQPSLAQMSETNVAFLVLESIFHSVPELREEILQQLFESTKLLQQSKLALAQLRYLFATHTRQIEPLRHLVEDWLSSLSSAPHPSQTLEPGFAVVSPFIAVSKDFYNFAMVLVRKQLSSLHMSDRRLAVEIWSSWLESSLDLDEQQEEEVILAIKNAIHLSTHRLLPFQRLERVISQAKLRPSSLVDLHRFCSVSLREFIELSDGDSWCPESDTDDADQDNNNIDFPLINHLRFRVLDLNHVSTQSISLDAALQLGPIVESIVSCLVGIEHTTTLSSSSPRHISTGEYSTGQDVLRCLKKLIRHRKGFFHWVSSGDVQLRVEDPHFVWALAARVSIGCALLNLAVRRSIQVQPIECQRLRGVWEMIEYQLALGRLWRCFSAIAPSKNLASYQKDHQGRSVLLETTSMSLQPHIVTLLRAVADVFDTASQSVSRSSDSGASLDGVLCVLDIYVRVIASSSRVLNTDTAVSALKSLVAIYKAASTGERYRLVFTTYAEGLASHFPQSMRHLVAPDSSISLAVTLDTQSCDEVRSRVCVAITKTLDQESARQSSTLLGLSSLVSETTETNSDLTLADVAIRLLADVRRAISDDTSTKSRTAGIALVKRIVEVATSKDCAVSDRHIEERVGNEAYELLCDHVVHQPPLLRALLMLSFRTTPLDTLPAGAAVDRIAATLTAAGFDDCPDVTSKDTKSASEGRKTNSNEDQAPRRRGLCVQDTNDNESQEGSDVENGGVSDSSEGDSCTLLCRIPLRQPHLNGPAAQEAGLVAALIQLESLHASAAQQIASLTKTTLRRRDEEAPVMSHDDTLVLLRRQGATMALLRRIYTLLTSTVFASVDIRWMNARALNKLLSIVKASTRVGRYCSSAAISKCNDLDRESILGGFEWSIKVAVHGRAWVILLREGSRETGTKQKLSSTILKLDVFLLDVPLLIASLSKSEMISPSSKRNLRVFLSTIEKDIAFSNRPVSTTTDSKSSSAKRHLVGVVPIVHSKRRKRLRSRHPFIDSCLAEEDGDDAFADLEDFIA